MGLYTVTFDILGSFSGGVPQLRSLYGDVEFSIDYAYASSTPVSFQIDTDVQPFSNTLLRFIFDPASGSSGDTIDVTNIRIDGVSAGADLSLNHGASHDYDVSTIITDTQFGAPGTGAGTAATINGTAGVDKLEGTNTADTINALGDDDTVYGGDGDDLINGDGGHDDLYGNGGANTINGGDGDDRIDGGSVNDILNGDNGNDVIYGGAGNDTINGGTGNDILGGNDGVDTIHGNGDNDQIRGGNGGDFLYGDDGDDNIDGQGDNDTIEGGNGNDTIGGDRGNDNIDGGANDDLINGGLGADILNGGTGNDIIHGGGLQTYDQFNIRNASAFGTSGVFYNEQTNSFYRFVNANVDFATAEAAAQAALLNGVGGHLVTITSQVENDYINLLVNDDAWTAGQDVNQDGFWEWTDGAEAGTIFSNGGTAVNNAYENWDAGQPQVNTEYNTVFTDGSGAWHDWAATATHSYVIEWDGEDVLADNSIDTLNGGGGNDQLYGGGGNDIINGDANNDILYGQAGNDQLNGGDHNDALYGGLGNDTLDGGSGNDTLQGDAATVVIGQTGQVITNQTSGAQWHTITFDATIINPIIKLALNTTNDADPVTLRVRNVTNTGFEWQMDEYEYLDGVHGTETISWMAIAAGTHTLDDGTVIQANTTTATNNTFTNVTFNSAFGSSPVIMTQLMTNNEATAAVLHNENRSTTGFRVQIEEQELNGTAHATETVGWIAIDNGGSVANGLLVGETGNNVTHATSTVNFGSNFASNSPVVLIDQQTEDGGDTALSRGITVSANQITFNIDEETSRDSETNHTTEIVGYYATTAGLIYANGDNGTDSISGGAGLDVLFGGDGADTFIFEAASAFVDTDIIQDFRYGQGDVLDISDLITGFSGTITDHVNFVQSGNDTIVQVDTDGGANSFANVARLEGVHGLDETLLYTAGGIVV